MDRGNAGRMPGAYYNRFAGRLVTTIVAEQTEGEHLMYAFDGRLYAQQPVMRTMLENYRRRLVRYFGYRPPILKYGRSLSPRTVRLIC